MALARTFMATFSIGVSEWYITTRTPIVRLGKLAALQPVTDAVRSIHDVFEVGGVVADDIPSIVAVHQEDVAGLLAVFPEQQAFLIHAEQLGHDRLVAGA